MHWAIILFILGAALWAFGSRAFVFGVVLLELFLFYDLTVRR